MKPYEIYYRNEEVKLDKFVFDYISVFENLINFLEDNLYDIKLIGFVLEIKGKWEEVYDIIALKDCCNECNDLYKKLDITNLMNDTKDIYKEVGKMTYKKIKNKEILKNKIKFENEYISVIKSINAYFSNNKN